MLRLLIFRLFVLLLLHEYFVECDLRLALAPLRALVAAVCVCVRVAVCCIFCVFGRCCCLWLVLLACGINAPAPPRTPFCLVLRHQEDPLEAAAVAIAAASSSPVGRGKRSLTPRAVAVLKEWLLSSGARPLGPPSDVVCACGYRGNGVR